MSAPRAVLVAGLPDGAAAFLARRLPGATVETAATASEAAAALQAGGWAALVLDAALAPPDGAALLLPARAAAPVPALLCLPPEAGAALSAATLESLGVRKLLLHPLDREELARQVAEVIGVSPAVRPSPEALSSAVHELWGRFREGVLVRVGVLEGAAVALLEGGLDGERRRAAEREAHRLAGSVGTFGFAHGSALARQIELLLQGVRELGQADALRLADLSVQLRAELERPAPEPAPRPDAPPPAADGVPSPLLLIVDDDAELAERLAMEAAGRGMRATVARTASEARAAVAREAPAAALVDLGLDESPREEGDGAAAGLGLVAELARRTPAVPVVVVTARSSFDDRVEVARHGGVGFLVKPVAPAATLDTVERVMRRGGEGRATVLTLDDEPAVTDAVARLLSGAGIVVHALNDPLRFWDALEAANPDVVVLDVDMPHLSGIEICRVIRNDPRWGALPVVFLTARNDAETIQRIFATGADDFVSKPFVGPELVTRIANRLERVLLHRNLADTDPLTGIANRRRGEEAIAQFVRLAQRQEQPFSLALLDLDRFKEVNDRHGHATGDEVLRRIARVLMRVFRAEDVVARWGGEEFAVGIYGMDKEEAVQRLAATLERVRDEPFLADDGTELTVTFSAGVAQFPADGADIATLLRTADAALYQAKEAGRARVVPAGWTPGGAAPTETVDVLVVEDDEALARLLVHALETRGYRTRWVVEGDRALAMLVGARPALRARAVLLDVDLPGLDGHGVLRALARERVLDRTRVLMVTVRSSEAEVLLAFEEGAFDHVAKPFSVPVLLQRVRRALRG